MNPNQMIYFNALVLQNDFRDEARRARLAEASADRPARARRTATKGRDHHILDRFNLAFPGRR